MDKKNFIHPFDPARNQPIQLPGNNIATEYSATSQTPDGYWIVHPQIWWSPDGKPAYLPGEVGMYMALQYERMTGHHFPRFSTVEDADRFASGRSKGGGGLLGMMGDD